MPRVLIIDDERNFRDFLAEALRAEGFDVTSAATARAGIAAARKESPNVVLLDQNLPDQSGLDLLPELRSLAVDPVVIVLTAHADYTRAVEAVKAGAFHYIMKPFDFSKLLSTLAAASVASPSEGEDADEPEALAKIIGSSGAISELKWEISRVARSPVATVLLCGDSGTGKELVARAIHDLSDRTDQPMISVNCGALTETLLMSQLFGHEKGAFTDASSEKEGVFEAANHGTLFLDEVAEMGPGAQAALLRVLEQRVITRVGGVKEIPVDVRIIAATNRQLDSNVAAGQFREDLFYRLNVVELKIPPLRQRGTDVLQLARHFSRSTAHEYGEEPRELTPEVEHHLLTHEWQGNVRELRNVIERAYVVGKTGEIEAGDLPLRSPRSSSPVATPDLDLEFKTAKQRVVERFEISYLTTNLRRAGGNVTRAAELSGLHRQGFQRLLTRHGLQSADFRE